MTSNGDVYPKQTFCEAIKVKSRLRDFLNPQVEEEKL